eukprot:TRINITY_DN5033_c0_g1_i4.p2 TRINITY_DN5033_c0_g1~~TRINITY_DN5033_c0_g1_i4.p2  ORF type:complete len:125 (-),score=1.04 TRINITY_DN5033_c0_g1_i4:64-438(-)
MEETLTQPCRVKDDGPMGCRLLFCFKKQPYVYGFDGRAGISIGQLRASSRGNTEGASVIRIHWVQSVRRRVGKSEVKARSLTVELPLILLTLSPAEVGGMQYVAVKCLDILQNTDCEGSLPNWH